MRLFILILFSTSLISFPELRANPASKPSDSAEKTLTIKLKEMAQASSKKLKPGIKKVMSAAIEELRSSKILATALKVGDKMPEFSLPDVAKGTVHSKDLLKKGPLIVVFYRGGWCPYCNLQLRDLQAHLETIKKTGAELVAISPQSPDNSLKTANTAELKFYVLSDVGNKVAKQFGLTFNVPDSVKKVYQGFGIDLEKSNSVKEWELPLGATYIVTPDEKIQYAFLDVDYKKRAETLDIIKTLEKLKSKVD